MPTPNRPPTFDPCTDFAVEREQEPVLRVLWIDDEAASCDLSVRLRDHAIAVEVVQTCADGFRKVMELEPDVIVLDVRLPDMYGVHAFARLRAMGVQCPIVVVTGNYFQPEVEAEARLLGAADFLHKPLVDLEHLARVLRNAYTQTASDDVPLSEPIYGIIAASPETRDVLAWLKRVAPSAISVLLTGETGTGKELVASAIHRASGRRGRFMPVSCGAIPESLFESVVFGHAAGAFTGATGAKAGLIEEAHNGTLFLDEIGELSLQLQVALLRVLETGEVWRVGETKPRPVDVRVIAATNRVLKEEIARGRFRLDLYYRLAGAVRQLLPLRERPEDIGALIHYWLTHRVKRCNGPAASISPGALRTLRAQPWPGNARELRNVFDRALCLLDGPLLTEREIAAALSPETPSGLPSDHAESKRARAEDALRAAGGNARRASSLLGINKATLYRWLRLDQGAPDAVHEGALRSRRATEVARR